MSNKEQFKKNVGQRVRVQPALQLYADRGAPEVHDDVWLIVRVTDDEFELENLWNQHHITLGFDSYFNFVIDAEGRKRGTHAGILVLKAQLYMHAGRLDFAATIAPGKELKDFTPPTPRPTARSTAHDAARRAQQVMHIAEYMRSPEGVQAGAQAFLQVGDALSKIESELVDAGTPVPMEIWQEPRAFLLKACGWWVTITWQANEYNGLVGNLLTLIKWYGPPPWPGRISLVEGRQVTVTQYTFGISPAGQPAWLSNWNSLLSYTSRDIADRIVQELIERPQTEPVLLAELNRRARERL